MTRALKMMSDSAADEIENVDVMLRPAAAPKRKHDEDYDKAIHGLL